MVTRPIAQARLPFAPSYASSATGSRGSVTAGGPDPGGWRRAGSRLLGLTAAQRTLAAFALGQLGVLLGLAVYAFRHDDLTLDYGIFEQARFLISHGVLDPRLSLLGYPYWRSHGELIMWPLAWLLAPLSGFGLLAVQALATAVTSWVAGRWLLEELDRLTLSRGRRRWAQGAGLVFLFLSPWVYWANGFDFHFPALAAMFLMLAARALAQDRQRRAWLWVLLTLSCGDVAGTYVAGLGLGAALAYRGRRRLHGIPLVVAGAGWTLLLGLLHANHGSAIAQQYAFLAPGGRISGSASAAQVLQLAAAHPGRALAALWGNRVNVWANVAGVGLVGLVWPWAAGVAAPVLLANNLSPSGLFAQPSFQSVPFYAFVALGSGVVLGRLLARCPRFGPVVGLVLASQVLAWTAVWAPAYPRRWLLVSATSAAVVARADKQIPAGDQVIVSQGILGRFADRRDVVALLGPREVRLETSSVYVVLAPYVGIEAPVTEGAAALATVASYPGAVLVLHQAGVWMFRLHPTRLGERLDLGYPQPTLPAYLFRAQQGRPDLAGTPGTWRLAATGRAGYVLSGDYWLLAPGRYRVDLVLASDGAATAEVSNATTDTVLRRIGLPQTNGLRDVCLDFSTGREPLAHAVSGWGPFSASPPRPAHDSFEVRLYAPARATVSVYSVQVSSVRAPGVGCM